MDERPQVGPDAALVPHPDHVAVGVAQRAVVVGVELGGREHQARAADDGDPIPRGRQGSGRVGRRDHHAGGHERPRLDEPAEQDARLRGGDADEAVGGAGAGQGEQAALLGQGLAAPFGRRRPLSAGQHGGVEQRLPRPDRRQLALHAAGQDDGVPLPAGGAEDRRHRDRIGRGRRGHPVGVDLRAGDGRGWPGRRPRRASGFRSASRLRASRKPTRASRESVAVAVVGHQVGEAVAPDLEGQLGRRVDGGPCRQPVAQADQRGQPGVGVQRGVLGAGPAPDAPGLERVEPGQG